MKRNDWQGKAIAETQKNHFRVDGEFSCSTSCLYGWSGMKSATGEWEMFFGTDPNMKTFLFCVHCTRINRLKWKVNRIWMRHSWYATGLGSLKALHGTVFQMYPADCQFAPHTHALHFSRFAESSPGGNLIMMWHFRSFRGTLGSMCRIGGEKTWHQFFASQQAFIRRLLNEIKYSERQRFSFFHPWIAVG